MDAVINASVYIFAILFITGFLSTVLTGSFKIVKILLIVVSGIFFVVTVVALVFSRGLVVFLLPQIVVLVIIVCSAIVIGAGLGNLVFRLREMNSAVTKLGKTGTTEFMQISEFSVLRNVSEEKIIGRIKSGYYLGGRDGANWYIHKSEIKEQ